MSEASERIEQIEISIKQAKDAVDMMKSMRKLMVTPLFKEVINKRYLEHEAVRLVALKCDPSMQTPTAQKDIDEGMIAISQFRIFVRTILLQGEQAERAITADEQTREEILAEDV